MSTGVMLEEKQIYKNAGMDGFVEKPNTIQQLTAELLRLLTWSLVVPLVFRKLTWSNDTAVTA